MQKETDVFIRQKGFLKLALSFLPFIYAPIAVACGAIYAGLGAMAMAAGAAQIGIAYIAEPIAKGFSFIGKSFARTFGVNKEKGEDQKNNGWKKWKNQQLEDGKLKMWGGARMIGCGLIAPAYLPLNLFYDGIYNIVTGKNSGYSVVSFAERNHKMLRNKDETLHLGNTITEPTKMEKISYSLKSMASRYRGINDMIYGSLQSIYPFSKETRKSGSKLYNEGREELYKDNSQDAPRAHNSVKNNPDIREFDTRDNIEIGLVKLLKKAHNYLMGKNDQTPVVTDAVLVNEPEASASYQNIRTDDEKQPSAPALNTADTAKEGEAGKKGFAEKVQQARTDRADSKEEIPPFII